MPRPSFNPNNADHLHRLYRAIRWSKDKLRPFRQHNLLSIKQLAGRFYGDADDAMRVPVNLLELAYTVYLRHLAGGAPRIHSWSPWRSLRPYALDFELVMNDVLEQIKFVDSQRAAVGNALLSMGMVKCGVEAGETIGEYSEKLFVDSINIDHWVHDMTATVWPLVQYMGNAYSMPEDIAKETREFTKRVSSELVAQDATTIGPDGNDSAQSVGVNQTSNMEDGRLHPCVPLLDIFLPMDRLLITIDGNFMLDKPLRVLDLDDEHEFGVFHKLSFLELDQNTVPLPPSALWMDLHRLANNIFNKLENQAKNSRNITTFAGPEGAQAAEKMNATNDGGACEVPIGNEPKPLKTTGIDQVNLAFLLTIKDLFGYLGGNLDALGGLGPQSPTLGQDQLLQAGASQRLAEMHDRVHQFQSEIVRDIAKYEHSGTESRVLSKSVTGDLEVQVNWNERQRKIMGPLEQYQIKIQLYSSMGTSPSMKLNSLAGLFNNFIMPMLPMWQRMGYGIEPRGMVETLARLSNCPELESWITAMGIPISNMGDSANASPKPPQTKRTYERVNRSQSTHKTRDQVLMQSLLGNMPQPSEAGRTLGATG